MAVQRYGKGLDLAKTSKAIGGGTPPELDKSTAPRPTMPRIGTPRAAGGDADGTTAGNFLPPQTLVPAVPKPDQQAAGADLSIEAQQLNASTVG